MSDWGIAGCYADGEPLVSTFAFRGKEFICVRCGRLYEFLEPVHLEETPELLARMEENRLAWRELSKGYLAPGGYHLNDCEKCQNYENDHLSHATPEELVAHEAAKVRINVLRTTKVN